MGIAEDTGSVVELTFNNSKLEFQIKEAFDPPLFTSDDIYPRMEGYVKDFKKSSIGTIHLEKGTGLLTLKAKNIPASQVMDFRMLLFRKL